MASRLALAAILLSAAASAAGAQANADHVSRVRKMRVADIVDLPPFSSTTATTTTTPATPSPTATGNTMTIDEAFEAFIVAFNRPYGNDPAEKARRRGLFENNLLKATEQQKQSDEAFAAEEGVVSAADVAVFGVTQFSDEDMDTIHARRRRNFNSFVKYNYQADNEDASATNSRSNKRTVEGGSDASSTEAAEGPLEEILQGRRRYLDLDTLSVETTTDGSPSTAKRATAAQRFWAKHEAVAQRGGGGEDTNLSAESNQRAMAAMATPSALDWRQTSNVISAVKDQGNCGSCWSFSATGNLEALWVINGHTPTLLSEQEMLSCDVKSGNDACEGGLMQAAFWWIMKYRSGYLSRADTYPFTSGNGVTEACDVEKSTPGALMYDWGDIKQSESVMMQALHAIGPACVGVDSTSLDNYLSGVMLTCTNRKLDHAVLVVGYDNSVNPPYWIVKNSWTTAWGEAGYMRVKLGINACGIRELASTALVSSDPITLPDVAPTTPEPNRSVASAFTAAAMIVLTGATMMIGMM